MIEEYMLLANERVARKIAKGKIDLLIIFDKTQLLV